MTTQPAMTDKPVSEMHGFVEVSKDKFFKAVGGPENIHPRSEPDHSAWEVVGSRELVGRTTPGYKNGRGQKCRYFLTDRFFKLKDHK